MKYTNSNLLILSTSHHRSVSPVSKPQRHSEFSKDDTCIRDIIFIVSSAKIFRYVFIIRCTCSKELTLIYDSNRIDTNYLYQKASITTSNKKKRRKSCICICINLNNIIHEWEKRWKRQLIGAW